MGVRGALIGLLLVLVAVGGASLRPAGAEGPHVGYPNSMAALGDSITKAADTTSLGDHPEDSWATGTNPMVNSLYSRLLVANPAISGNRFNDAVSGARMTDLNGQAAMAVSQGVDLVVVLMGANDVCTTSEANMLPVATFQTQFQAALQTISSGLPNARIAVASIPDVYNLWEILHNDANAQFVWSFASICQSLLANPTSMAPADVTRRANVRQRNMDFNTVLHDVCAQYVHCLFDNYVGFNTTYTVSDISSLDYFHPSIQGQALAASTAWSSSYDFTDATPPVSTSAGTVAAGNATVTMSATDASGVSGIEYRINSGAYQKYTGGFVAPVGTHITSRAVDRNGNTEATHECTVQAWSWMPGDGDCDGFSNAAEAFLGIDANDGCPETTTPNDEPDDWPADFNDSMMANTLDLTVYASALNKVSGDPAYVARADLNGNGAINTLDLVPYASMLNKGCLP